MIEGRPAVAPSDLPNVNIRKISPDYLRAMNIPLLRGRAITAQDTKDAPRVMLVNETLARRLFPGEDTIGKRVLQGRRGASEIVGIVGDVKHRSLDVEAGAEYYMPYLQSPEEEMTLVTRSTTSVPSGLVAAVRNVIGEIDKDQPISDIKPMSQLLAEAVAPQRFNMLLLGIFAFVALALASVGIFGVMNYTVTQRTHEIGIRLALGAQTTDVLRLIVTQGMMLALIGVGIGLAGSFATTRLMRSLLYGVSATDPLIFFAVSLLLSVVALLACYIPARRATKVDPMIALRYE
ncbi:MAG: ABC transporter permease [Pyrinomonadaceae bacterium]|nr:ABC transporter permease [Pyrinomonadaceae bacterium]